MTNTTNATGLGISMERVTPAIAEKWLGKNTHNRKINDRIVRAMVRDLEDGNWIDNGATITFSDEGVLLDGQHRLNAIVNAGIGINSIIVRGAKAEAQHTMDTGAKRTLANALELRGEKNCTKLGSAIAANINYDRSGRIGKLGGSASVTNSEALDYLEKNPWVRDQLPEVARICVNMKGLKAGMVSVLYRVLFDIDPEDADFFFQRLLSDEDHHKGEPIYTLRKSLMLDAARTDGHRPVVWKAAVIIKAWNKFRDGEECSNLSFVPGGSRQEEFPVPH